MKDIEASDNLWTCPECGNRFVTSNAWHSCGMYTLEDLFASSEPVVLDLFEWLVALVGDLGEVTVIPQKTRVTTQAQVRFISCYPRRKFLLAGFWFPRYISSPRFHKITKYRLQAYVHDIRITDFAQFDDEFRGWVYTAYQVGLRRHFQ